MIQLPVTSLERKWYELVAGTYMDEFAESHTKDMVVRESVSGVVPSAGVGTCFSRRAMDALVGTTHNKPFNTDSQNEDYDVGNRLAQLDMQAIFGVFPVSFRVERTSWLNAGDKQEQTIDMPLSQAANLKRSLDYALPRGAEIVMLGYTHRYSNMRNKYTGVSGDDYEFWNIVANTPVAEDSTQWALGRYRAGLNELLLNGYNPVAWEAPRYHASPLASRAITQVFKTTYQRVVYFTADTPNLLANVSKDFAVGQIFPYVIPKDYYGQRVLPESVGNIEYDISAIDASSSFNYTWQDLMTNAKYGLVVRDGFASFFFHPFWLDASINKPGFADLKSLIDGITGLGYAWVAPSKVLN